jgi:alkylhydroperoxidase/carboxymuconolactone decarboxylase family protein YurZ
LASEKRDLKEDFIARRGYWHPAWEQVLRYDPEYLAAYLDLSAPKTQRALEKKTQELILLAVDIAATHLYRPGARVHLEGAMKAGATRRELMEVFELVSLIGVHSVVEGALLLAELDNRDETRIQDAPGQGEETSTDPTERK